MHIVESISINRANTPKKMKDFQLPLSNGLVHYSELVNFPRHKCNDRRAIKCITEGRADTTTSNEILRTPTSINDFALKLL